MSEGDIYPHSITTFEARGRRLFVIMVVVGYALTFSLAIISGEVDYSPLELIGGILFGFVYIYIGLNDILFKRLLPEGWSSAFYFFILCGLVLGIGWVLGPGGNWLIGIPLVGVAVQRLQPRWRWAVYFGVLFAVVLPIGLRHSDWITALYNKVIRLQLSFTGGYHG